MISVRFVFSETNNVLFCKINREEKSLRQVAKVAKFLDNNKPIKSLYSNYFKLNRSYSISFNLATLGEIFFGTVSIVI